MQCALYDAGRCRSCQWITQPIPEQLSAKTADLKNLLADFPVEEWCAPVSGPEQGFRNKAKIQPLQTVSGGNIILDTNEVPIVYPKKSLRFLLIIMALPIGNIWRTICVISKANKYYRI